MRNNPLDVVNIFTLSNATYRKMVGSAVGDPGVFAPPLAAGILAPVGIPFSAVGAVLMPASAVIIYNMLRQLNAT